MVRAFGRPQLARHGKELYPLAMWPVMSGSGARPCHRPAQEGVPMMGWPHQGVQAVAVGIHERGGKSKGKAFSHNQYNSPRMMSTQNTKFDRLEQAQ